MTARSFSLFNQKFELSDTISGRSGPALLGAVFDLDWSSRYADFFGPGFANNLNIQNGLAGQYADLGQGNTLSCSLGSLESSITVTPLVPDPGTAVLLAFGLLGLSRHARRAGAGRPPLLARREGLEPPTLRFEA